MTHDKLSAGRSALGILPAIVVALAVLTFSAAPSLSQSARWGQNYLPNVELTTQDGRKVRFYDDVIKGKVVLINFIFTSCLDICPLITARLADVYERLGEGAGRDFHFVTVSIDPVRDTPERMKRHADAFRTGENWLFLTGKPEDVQQVRHKLGERSRKITEHGSQVLLYNDRTGEWLKDSVFAELGVLALTIQNMDPAWRARNGRTGGNDPTLTVSLEQPGRALYTKACASCHSVGGGDKVGPDLAGVTTRRSRDWLLRFMRHPAKMHATGDPIAVDLAAKYPKIRMPNLQLSDTDISDLLTYLDARGYAAVSADMAGPHGHGKALGPAAKSGGGHKH